MRIIPFTQGTEEWKQSRRGQFTASEASAMMGVHKNVKRSDLLARKATGSEQEFSEWFQANILDHGHKVEAKALSIAEAIIGEELFPVTGVDDALGLLASYDGLTEMHDTCWECKQWNTGKAAMVERGLIPPTDFWQVVQQTAIGPNRCLYMVTDGTPDKCVHVWYERDEKDVQRLLAGWKQFDEDLKGYVPEEIEAPVVGEAVKSLPAVSVQVSGSLDIKDNFAVFGAALRDFVEHQLIREPSTDQDFADLDGQIKTLKKAEDALKAAEEQIFSQVATIDDLKRTKDALYKMARDNRLLAERLLKSEKENRRREILQGGKDALHAHIRRINESMRVSLPDIKADFAGAMKGKRTIASLKDAVDTTLAHAKIEANQIADKIRINLLTLTDEADAEHMFLFSDLQSIATKENDDFRAMVKVRISDYEAAQEKARAEREEQIRQKAVEAERQKAAEAERQKAVEAERQRAAEAERQKAAERRVRGRAENVGTEREEPSRPGDGDPQTQKTVVQIGSRKHAPTPRTDAINCLMQHTAISEATARQVLAAIERGLIDGVAVVYPVSAA